MKILTNPCEHPCSMHEVSDVIWCPWCLDEMLHSEPEKWEVVNSEIEAARRQAGLNVQHKNALILPRFADKTFENYEVMCSAQKQVKDYVAGYALDFKTVEHDLVFIGRTGTGKDHLAVSLAKVVIAAGFKVLFSDAEKLHRRIRDGYKQNITEQEVMDEYARVDLLIVNELGVRTSPALASFLTEISNDRVNNLKKTLWIGNLNLVEFADLMGDRAFDRIVRKNRSNVMIFDWQSHRE